MKISKDKEEDEVENKDEQGQPTDSLGIARTKER